MDKIRSVKKRKIDPDKVFDIVNLLIMLVLLVIFVWPLWFVLIASISDPSEVWQGHVVLFPRGITLAAYEEVIKYKTIWKGYANTILYTVLGTAINMVLTVCGAYPLSRKDFVPKKFFMLLFMVTMYFSAGLIPLFLTYRTIGIYNTFWVYIIPGIVTPFNLILCKTYIESLPASLEESAEIDGAGYLVRYFRLILPLSKPILATVSVFSAVGQWNNWMDTVLYTKDKSLQTLQYVLYRYLNEANTLAEIAREDPSAMNADLATQLSPLTIKYTISIVTILPILLVYPFFQKYFVKGIMIGAVKG